MAKVHEAAGKSDEWYTPRYIFDDLKLAFDLDVAAPKNGPAHVPAKSWYWQDSLEKDWFGLVWMNPPFGNQSQKRLWLKKFVQHGSGVALVPDRSSAPWFQEYIPMTDAQLWVAPKIKFERPDGTRGESPSTGTVLIAMGKKAEEALAESSLGFCTKIIKTES